MVLIMCNDLTVCNNRGVLVINQMDCTCYINDNNYFKS